MSEKQTMIKILEKMPDDISMDDILETMILIHELKNRLDNVDDSTSITSEELKRRIQSW